MTRIQKIVDRVEAAYAVLEPQAKTDAYDGMESARITGEMLSDPFATVYTDAEFIEKVYQAASGSFDIAEILRVQ